MFVLTKSNLRHISAYRKSEGLSGRILRKLPFLAHALYIQVRFYFIKMIKYIHSPICELDFYSMITIILTFLILVHVSYKEYV